MPLFDIICMANSKKLTGRCVAGLQSDGSRWIRPVTDNEHGTLFYKDYTLTDGNKAQVLDLLRIELIEHTPELHQPENWQIGPSKWKLLHRPESPACYMDILKQHIISGPDLFGNTSDKIRYAELKEAPTESSLALIAPNFLRLRVVTSYSGKRQVRAHFPLGTEFYNLAVTDLEWKKRTSNLAIGESKTVHNIMMTISLGEPFQGSCYKLVAAIIPL